MSAVIQSLLCLQEIETQLWSLRDGLAAKNLSITAQQKKLLQLQQQTQQKRDQRKHAQAEAASQELDIKTQEAEISKLRTALNTAKTNKEYDAIISQINSDRTEIARQEEKVLALLAQIDQMDAECSQIQQQIAQTQERLDSLSQARQEALAQSEQELTRLEQDKSQLVESISPAIMTEFKRVSQSYNGQAMAAVTQTDPGNGVYCCSGCYMSITIDTVDFLMSKDEIRQCPNCQRLLYIPADKS